MWLRQVSTVSPNPDVEWTAYLDTYQAHLANVRETLEQGKVTTRVFNATPPSTHLPLSLKQRAQSLQLEGDNLTKLLEERMTAFATVLRYSRMKHSDKVVLIDVMA